MKNKIIIDIDSEREKPLIIGKGSEYQPPTNKEEAKEMLITDLGCVLDALLSMVHVADQNGYADKHELIEKAIKTMNQYLSLPSTKPIE